jgi:hypothetical protein
MRINFFTLPRGLAVPLIEIVKVLRRYPRMVYVVKQRPMSIIHQCTVEVYVAVDGSEACLSLNPPKAYCTRDGSVKEIRLKLEFKRYETYEDKTGELYRPKGLLAYITAAREYATSFISLFPWDEAWLVETFREVTQAAGFNKRVELYIARDPFPTPLRSATPLGGRWWWTKAC